MCLDLKMLVSLSEEKNQMSKSLLITLRATPSSSSKEASSFFLGRLIPLPVLL